jgi:hypothetical protein
MTNFKSLCRKLADRLRDANELLAYLSERNIIDDAEPIMKNWELLADVENELADPDND